MQEAGEVRVAIFRGEKWAHCLFFKDFFLFQVFWTDRTPNPFYLISNLGPFFCEKIRQFALGEHSFDCFEISTSHASESRHLR